MQPDKDKQLGDVADTRATDRHRTWRASHQTQGQRNLPPGEQGPRKEFHTDEHPEIPKVRRASLYLDQHISSSRHPVTRARGTEIERTQHSLQKTRKAKQYAYNEAQERHTESMSTVGPPQHRRAPISPPSTPQASILSKPSQTPQSRNKSRQPLPPRPQRHKVSAPFAFLPPFAQRQNLLTIAGSAIAFIFILIVISSLLHTPVAVLILPGLNTSSTPTDPHKLVITPVNSDHPAPPVYAQAAYLLDADTGNTLYAYNPFTHLPVMSTTKLMTALLAAEHGNLDQTITINGQITREINQLSPDSSTIAIKAGESYTLRQLMYGLLLASGNDAAVAIATTIGGSYANFIAMMNQKTEALGLHDTHFMNPHGLQEPNHYSSAHDLAIIGSHSLTNPIVHEISGTLNYHIDGSPQHAAHDFFNGNQLIWWYPGIDAGKPGYDAATNFVQVVSCVRNNHRLIGVTIHTIDWWTDMRNLMNWGFNTYTWVSPHDLNTADHPIPYAGLWGNFDRDRKENTIPTSDNGRYYIYTGYSITGNIKNYFDGNGGLTTFGFPTSQPGTVGNDTLRQRFERGTIQCNTQRKQCQKGT